jgi:hypothetical protein
MEPWGWVSCSPPKDVSPTVLVAQISQRGRSHVQPGAGPIAKYPGDQPRSRGMGSWLVVAEFRLGNSVLWLLEGHRGSCLDSCRDTWVIIRKESITLLTVI